MEQKTAKKFIVMRGISGSGKSTTAEKLVGAEGQIFSTDHYWHLKNPKKYDFDINKLGEAHKWNQRRTLAAVHAEIPVIIVDNTNVTLKELRGYKDHIKLALEKGYEIHIVESNTSWAFDVDELCKKNTHNVPRATIEKMVSRYQKNLTVEDILRDN